MPKFTGLSLSEIHKIEKAKSVNRYSLTEQKIKKWTKQGRGLGDLDKYLPWLTFRDVPSEGWRRRTKGLITKRYHHTLSQIEYRVLVILDLLSGADDIKEAFPLFPREETEKIAAILKVDHPKDHFTNTNIVITTDFLIYKNGKRYAISVKPFEELGDLRVIEKLSIEWVYWLSRGVQFVIITNKDIPSNLADTCAAIHGYCKLDFDLSEEFRNQIVSYLTQEVKAELKNLNEIAAIGDKTFGLRKGTCLALAHQQMAQKKWVIDFSARLDAGSILKLIRIQP